MIRSGFLPPLTSSLVKPVGFVPPVQAVASNFVPPVATGFVPPVATGFVPPVNAGFYPGFAATAAVATPPLS